MDLRLGRLTDTHGGVVTTAAALGAGVSPGQVRWAVERGALIRIERGAYVEAGLWRDADDRVRHLLRVRAAQLQAPDTVAVAESAALTWGFPLPGPPPQVPRLALPRAGTRAGGRGARAGVVGRRAWLPDDEIAEPVDGIRVTTPARAVFDCARHLDRPWALAVGDAARRYRRVTRGQLVEVAQRHRFAPGHPAGAWVAGLADPAAETALESLARAVIVLAGHPAARLQVWLSTSRGMVRVDLLAAGGGVVIEADGRVKYTDRAVLWREKLREDAIRATGREMVRFTYRDYRNPDPWLRRYQRALDRARGSPTVRS